MDYMLVVAHVLLYHAARSVLLVELPASSIIRGEHTMGTSYDGSTRCIAMMHTVLMMVSYSPYS